MMIPTMMRQPAPMATTMRPDLARDPWEYPAAKQVARLMSRMSAHLAPPPPLTIREWAERYRVMSAEETPYPGPYDAGVTPVVADILDMISQPGVRLAVIQKSAQIGYSAGVVCNVLGYYAHWRPSTQVVVFPRDQAAKDFAAEKFDPMVRATPPLAERIALKSRALGNSQTRKRYPGGMIKLVGSLSPSGVKSTSARIVIIEEPDDVAEDVRGQGSSIRLAQERAKWFDDALILVGGTPTAKGASAIEAMMGQTDRRRCYIGCHDCGEDHVLDWANVNIPRLDGEAAEHEIYGAHDWRNAAYACPHCGSIWSDEQRIANIRQRRRWQSDGTPDAASIGVYTSELYATGDASRIPMLARKWCEADAKLQQGDASLMIAFANNSLGEPWEYRGELPEADELAAREEGYGEWACPAGGLVPLLNVDVQHDRLAITCWVVGRGDEMWLAHWSEIHGQTIVPGAGAWVDLLDLMDRTVRHESGAALRIAAVGIDCSDGKTSDAVYDFVRRHHRGGRPVLALKGAPDDIGRVEIWTPPKPIDPANRSTKAAKHGVLVHIVGTARAKDLILGYGTEGGRIRLEGSGHGRMHWYKGVRADLYEQLLSEIKIPSRRNQSRRAWRKLSGVRNEALDCTTGALYLARHLRLHLRKPHQWDYAESMIRQAGIGLEVEPPADAPAEAAKDQASVAPVAPAPQAHNAFAAALAARKARRQ